MLDVQRVRARLPGRRIEWFDSIDSTMNVAARLAREGCAVGTIVGAEEQTAGIGRHGHSWHSEAGAGLYVSLVLDAPASSNTLVMLALGLAAQQAIMQIAGLNADLRWPNDVLVDGKKCAGIIAHGEGSKVIAGIGINVNHGSFPPDIAELATSLLLAGAPQVAREDLLVALIEQIDEQMRCDAAEIRNRFERGSSYARGRHVRVDLDDSEIEGITEGLDAAGFLLVKTPAGEHKTILAGGVRPA